MLSFSDPKVEAVFNNYPVEVRERLLELRNLVFEVANSIEEVGKVEECLKWGEPSYITKIGSTVRMDWKARDPEQYALYFSCSTSLVQTFKTVFKDHLHFEGNRAIVFHLNEPLPKAQIQRCIQKGLTYKKVKHLPLLGF